MVRLGSFQALRSCFLSSPQSTQAASALCAPMPTSSFLDVGSSVASASPRAHMGWVYLSLIGRPRWIGILLLSCYCFSSVVLRVTSSSTWAKYYMCTALRKVALH